MFFLIQYNWLYFIRKNNKYSIIFSVFVYLAHILFTFCLGLSLIFLDKILLELKLQITPLQFVNKYILIFFIYSLPIRYFVQNLPFQSINDLILLPIQRRIIIHFFIFRIMFNKINFSMILLLIPFGIKYVMSTYSSALFIFWFVCILFISWLVNNFIVFIKLNLTRRPRLELILFLLFGLLIVLDAIKIISINNVSTQFFDLLIINRFYIFIPLSILVCFYYLIYNSLLSQFYEFQNIKNEFRKNEINSKLNGLFSLEIKTIARNRLCKEIILSFLMMNIILVIGIYVISRLSSDLTFFNKFSICMFFNVSFSVTYGKILFGIESSYYDLLMINQISMQKLIFAKFFIYFLFSTFSFLLGLFCNFLFSLGLELIMSEFYFYYLSFGFFVVLISVLNKPIKVNLNERGLGNKNYNRNIVTNILIFTLFGVNLIFHLFWKIKYGASLVILLSIFLLVLWSFIVNFIVKELRKKKYYISDIYRGE